MLVWQLQVWSARQTNPAWVRLTNKIDSLHLISSEAEVQTAESSLWVHCSDLCYTLKFPVAARKLPAVQLLLSPAAVGLWNCFPPLLESNFHTLRELGARVAAGGAPRYLRLVTEAASRPARLTAAALSGGSCWSYKHWCSGFLSASDVLIKEERGGEKTPCQQKQHKFPPVLKPKCQLNKELYMYYIQCIK